MFKSLSQALIAAAMLIALLGQSLAYAHIACEMPMDASHSMSHDSMNHSLEPAHGDMDHQTMMNSMSDCCGADCSCPSSSCTNISSLLSKQTTVEFEGISNARFSDSLGQPKALTSTLFRPPILA
ncbi:hypothetical protein [Pseudoteredinibacter isoporae]|uniref:Uncharacterized protein n=1 Tax=Pseudoteredinibacter isoporae TaxID=570281 RepID=A0A7X0MX48_9GAMM|nr:hypothetical protein [Pseudoteredinibacter isoporae]MBB6520502.1 hypothetical protein [Pseudoteredinibacter isoporae]NHO86069.1 hypothetical protein [Pseudoteredinibacter isoporae]NIB25480.1 hypothetical protein [Pseudoteredinibacter isoporae]